MIYRLWINGVDTCAVNPSDFPLAKLQEENPDNEYQLLAEGQTPNDEYSTEDQTSVNPFDDEMYLATAVQDTITVNDLLIEENQRLRKLNNELEAENLKLRNQLD